MLSDEQILKILDKINDRICTDNRTGMLENTLLAWGIPCDFFERTNEQASKKENNNPGGKIVIIGSSAMKRNKFEGMIKAKYGLSNAEVQKRFELVFEYEGLNHYDFNKLSKDKYAVILIGPVPHSVRGKGDSSSVIVMLEENKEDRPPVYRLNQDEPISKSQVGNALDELVKSGVVKF